MSVYNMCDYVKTTKKIYKNFCRQRQCTRNSKRTEKRVCAFGQDSGVRTEHILDILYLFDINIYCMYGYTWSMADTSFDCYCHSTILGYVKIEKPKNPLADPITTTHNTHSVFHWNTKFQVAKLYSSSHHRIVIHQSLAKRNESGEITRHRIHTAQTRDTTQLTSTMGWFLLLLLRLWYFIRESYTPICSMKKCAQ